MDSVVAGEAEMEACLPTLRAIVGCIANIERNGGTRAVVGRRDNVSIKISRCTAGWSLECVLGMRRPAVSNATFESREEALFIAVRWLRKMEPRDKSKTAFERAKRLMPGGVNSPARAFGGVGGEPIFFARGEGAYLYDLDGNRYIDYVGSWGPLILGHAHPDVTTAVMRAATCGTSFGAPTEAESELCQLIIEAVPSVEKVRLVNSGTEATMSAIRLARGFTGRDAILKFGGNYHGHVDSLLVAAGSSAATLGVPNSPGVTAGTAKDTLALQYNDAAGLEAAFKEHGTRIAGVIVEPVVGNMGVVVPSGDFLSALRRLTERNGALLIFDEVMTGFRVAYGGAQ